MKKLTLAEYIVKKFNGRKGRFASYAGVSPAQVTQWLKKDFIVVDNTLYAARRSLHEAKCICCASRPQSPL